MGGIKIFLSYRRQDSQPVTERLYDYLEKEFGADNIFKDVNDIEYGQDFTDVVQREINRSDVLLVIIGPNWLNIRNEHGQRRLDAEDDPVRIEVRTGLARGEDLLVIPVLIQGAKIPDKNELPQDLRRLSNLNAATLRNDPDFRDDVRRLIDTIKRRTDTLPHKPTPASKTRKPWLTIAAVIVVLIAGILLLLSSSNNGPETPTSDIISPVNEEVALEFTNTPTIEPTHTPTNANTITPEPTHTPTNANTITPEPTHTPHTPASTAAYTITIQESPTAEPCAIVAPTDAVRVHTGPGRNRSVIRYLRQGQIYAVNASSQDSDGATWWSIQYPNLASAWVMRNDVNAQGDCSAYEAPSTPTASPDDCFVIVPTDAVRVHTGPGRNRNVLRLLQAGDEYQAIAKSIVDDMKWYQIAYSGLDSAWVASEDVETRGNCD